MLRLIIPFYTLTKLDGVSPVENQPFTVKLHHFHHVTCDMGCGVNILSKLQLPSSYSLMRVEDLEEKDDWLNQLIAKVFVKQPQLHWVW